MKEEDINYAMVKFKLHPHLSSVNPLGRSGKYVYHMLSCQTTCNFEQVVLSLICFSEQTAISSLNTIH
jgi:hypothetical protein